MALVLGKGVKEICDSIMEEMGECIMHWIEGRICWVES